MPREKLPGGGRRFKYDLSEILVWLRTDGPWKNDCDDPLLSGNAESPSRERLCLAKAEIAELDLAERRGLLLPRDKVRQSLGRFGTVLRRAFEQVGKRYGHDALLRLNDALAECERLIDDDFGDGDAATGATP